MTDAPPTAASPGRDARVLQTLRELTAPAEALCRRTRRLAEQVRPEAPAPFRKALANMQERARQLLDHVSRPLTTALVREGPSPIDRAYRHDLRGHAAFVLMTCDFWRQRGPALALDAHLPELQGLADAAGQIVAFLDRLTAILTASAPAEGGTDTALAQFRQQFDRLPISRERGRLLVVDDNVFNREHLREVLVQHGHEVVEAEDGEVALALVAAETFDLILLDVMMPKVSGYEVLERLKAQGAWQHIPVIMISALDQLDSVIHCVVRGAEDYLIRPCNELLLQARVGACLEKKRLRDREGAHLRCIDDLLHAIFPPELVVELKETQTIRPRRHERVGVLFLDIVGFTSFCDGQRDRPEVVVDLLQRQVVAFEQVAKKHGVQKVKTIGDAFMAVAGLLRPCDNPVLTLVRCGLDLIECARQGVAGWQVRVGVHVGPVVAGKLGESQYSFDLWGATVNLAARMESSGRPGIVTLSPQAWEAVAHVCRGAPRDVAVRGIGGVTVWDVVPS